MDQDAIQLVLRDHPEHVGSLCLQILKRKGMLRSGVLAVVAVIL